MSWVEVPQARHRVKKQWVTIGIVRHDQETNRLRLAVSIDLAVSLGWEHGTTLGLWYGQDEWRGWLSVGRATGGSDLFDPILYGSLGPYLTCNMVLPEAWKNRGQTRSDAIECQWQIRRIPTFGVFGWNLKAKNRLLIQVPAGFTAPSGENGVLAMDRG